MACGLRFLPSTKLKVIFCAKISLNIRFLYQTVLVINIARRYNILISWKVQLMVYHHQPAAPLKGGFNFIIIPFFTHWIPNDITLARISHIHASVRGCWLWMVIWTAIKPQQSPKPLEFTLRRLLLVHKTGNWIPLGNFVFLPKKMVHSLCRFALCDSILLLHPPPTTSLFLPPSSCLPLSFTTSTATDRSTSPEASHGGAALTIRQIGFWSSGGHVG